MSGTDKMAENISSSEELLDFLKRRARKHNNLKTYGAYDNIRPIVEEGVLRVSNGEKWNDKLDSSIFQQKSDEYLQFGKCFTFSKSESVAMWMIYGNNVKEIKKDHRALMIDFKKQLNKVIDETEKVTLYNYQDNKIKEKIEIGKEMFEIFLIDMLYVDRESDGSCTIKRSDERVEGVDERIIDDITDYTKSYMWAYENECRLILRVKKNILGDVNYNSAQLELPKNVKKVLVKSVYRSPLYPNETYDIATYSSKLEGNISF